MVEARIPRLQSCGVSITKEFCMDVDKMNAEEDLFFMCSECPFEYENDDCLVKIFKKKFCPDYKNFGSMGDLWRIYENR